MRILSTLLAASALLATAGQAQASKPRDTPEQKLAKAIEGRTPGKPVNCINSRDIRSTQIINGTAILYTSNNGTIYVNRPESGASFLRNGDALVTRTSISQLCNVDIVRLFDTASRFERGSIGLGEFVPYKKVRSASAN